MEIQISLDVAATVLVYFFIAPLLTWLNKMVLASPRIAASTSIVSPNSLTEQRLLKVVQRFQGRNFTVVFAQQLSTFILLTLYEICVVIREKPKEGHLQLERSQQYELATPYERTVYFQRLPLLFHSTACGRWAKRLLMFSPLALCFVLQLTLCNVTLRDTSLAVYQATRTSGLGFSVLLSYWVFDEKLSWGGKLCCMLIAGGFSLLALDSGTELHSTNEQQRKAFSFVVFLTGCAASLAGSLYMTLCKIYFLKSSGTRVTGATVQRRMVQWCALGAALLLSPLVLREQRDYRVLAVAGGANVGWRFLAFVATLYLSPLLALCTIRCLRSISPVGCSVAGFGKSCIQVLVGSWIFQDPITPRSVAGVILCLTACAVYPLFNSTQRGNQKFS